MRVASGRTSEVALPYVQRYTTEVVRVLSLRQKRGKGYAVKTGMLHARGMYLLMLDADGATRIQVLLSSAELP